MNINVNKGFTLIELLVVISIIGLLSSVVLSALKTTRSKARDAQRISTLQQISKALELYYDDNGHYPIAIFSHFYSAYIDSDSFFINNKTWKSNLSTKLSNGKYIATAGQDPYLGIGLPPTPFSGKGYAYWTNSTGSKYQLMGRLENKNPVGCSNVNYISTVSFGSFGPSLGSSLCGVSNLGNNTGFGPFDFTTVNANLYVISGNDQ